ncbi:MAG: tail fiber domain-containing protein [Flavobacteriales bacterium]|nr:tail fiber domain-containing protein [Flavobacteriales bacterium]
MRVKIGVFSIVVLLFAQSVFAQTTNGVMINYGAGSRDDSAILEAKSANQGFLAPRIALLSTTDATTILNPATSLLVYNTNTAGGVTPGYYYNSGIPATPVWIRLLASNATPIAGSGTTNYLARWTPNGNTLGIGVTYDNGTNVGIGTEAPNAKLHVTGNAGIGVADGDPIRTSGAYSGSADASLDVQGTGPIFLIPKATTLANPDGNTGAQDIFLPGHVYFLPSGHYASGSSMIAGEQVMIQARRPDDTGNAGFVFRTTNAGVVKDAGTILPDGKWGIGTTAPDQKLEVDDPSSTAAYIRIRGAEATGGYAGVEFSHQSTGNTTTKTAIVSDPYNSWKRSDLRFILNSDGNASNYNIATAADTKMIIKNGGNVGIGNINPQQRLDVVGTGRFSDLDANANRIVYADADGDLTISTSTIDPNALVDGSGATPYLTKWADANSLTNSVVQELSSKIGIGMSPVTTLDVSGNFRSSDGGRSREVGIGGYWSGTSTQVETGPGNHLLFGTSTSGNPTEKMRITNDGKVGIATTGPAANLHVEADANATAAIFDGCNAADNTAVISIRRQDLTARKIDIIPSGYDGTNTYQEIKFASSNIAGTHHVKFSNGTRYSFDGNVGIGTTSPSSKLDVRGSLSALTDYGILTLGDNSAQQNGLSFGYDSGNNWAWLYARTTGCCGRTIDINNTAYIQSGNGNVGIGTSGPSYKLHVAGDVYANGGWLRVSGNQGLFFESHGTGIQSVEADGGQYGSVSTYGNEGGWDGFSIDGKYVLMASGNSYGLYNDIDNRWAILIDRGTNADGFRFYNSNTGTINMRIQHTNGSNYASYDGDSNWDFYSDRRLKENIENEDNILDRLLKLDVVNYDFINQDRKEKEIGFIAQEVEKYFPSLVSESDDSRYDFKVKALGYSSFGVLAIGGIKELKLEKDEEIAGLNKTITVLKEEVDELRNLVNQLLEKKK